MRLLVPAHNYAVVAPPRGERGLKLSFTETMVNLGVVAPPRGERGLKYDGYILAFGFPDCRSPSWGAWIEISSL